MKDFANAVRALADEIESGEFLPPAAIEILRRLTTVADLVRSRARIGFVAPPSDVADLLEILDDYEANGYVGPDSVAAVSEYLQGLDAE